MERALEWKKIQLGGDLMYKFEGYGAPIAFRFRMMTTETLRTPIVCPNQLDNLD
jgi:hypothetical protein